MDEVLVDEDCGEDAPPDRVPFGRFQRCSDDSTQSEPLHGVHTESTNAPEASDPASISHSALFVKIRRPIGAIHEHQIRDDPACHV